MTFEARVVPRRAVAAGVVNAALLVLGLVAALAGDVSMGWVLAAFGVWSTASVARRSLRRGPAVTIDEHGVRDHRVPSSIAWADVERVRTVNRRVVFQQIPLLELVPRAPIARERGVVARAVLRGDVAFADARNRERMIVDLQHLDRTPEEVLAAVREHRGPG